MNDYLVKALAFNGQVRIYAANTTVIAQTAQKIHDTWSNSTAALGRTLTGAALLSAAVLKKSGRLTIKIQGNGPIGAIVADGDAFGKVKGYLHQPHVELALNAQHKIAVGKAVGLPGFLAVTKDLGLKTPFTGEVPLVSGEIGDDLTYYLAKSEQIPSAVGVSVFVEPNETVKTAGGFLVQVLPGASQAAISKVEKRVKQMAPIWKLMARDASPEFLIKNLVQNDQVEFLEKDLLKYECDCSKKRFSAALASISKKELQEIITKDHQAEAVCRFCGKKYQFSEAELRSFLKKKSEK
jgi:molecular chaperone Hsp33